MNPTLAQLVVQNSAEAKLVYFVFFSVWVLLGISSFLFFRLNRDAALKRRVFPGFIIGSAVVFVGFVAYMTRGQLKVLCFMVPAIALITFLNLRKTKFCDACGRTLYPKSFFTPTPFCPHCGAQVK